MFPPYFLDLPNQPVAHANATLLPLPFEATVSYGGGTGIAPAAIWRASTEVELWDEEVGFDLGQVRLHNASPIVPAEQERPAGYLQRVRQLAEDLHAAGQLLVAIGGEHGVTPPLVTAAAGEDLSEVTVVQFDAHLDLRDEYDGSVHSHACVMRRLVERGATVLAVGVRSGDQAEWEFAGRSQRNHIYAAQGLVTEPAVRRELISRLFRLRGKVYLTFDVDVFEAHLCPATGTPQPGGLSWWTTLELLKTLLRDNQGAQLIGVDVVETVPVHGLQVNEFVAARLIAKLLAYQFAPTTAC